MAKYGLGCQAQVFPEHSGKGEVFCMFHSIPPLQRAVEHLPNLQMLGPTSSSHRGCVAVWGVVKVMTRIKERGATLWHRLMWIVTMVLVWGWFVRFVIDAEPRMGALLVLHGANGYTSWLACGKVSGSRKGPSVGECMRVVYTLTGTTQFSW